MSGRLIPVLWLAAIAAVPSPTAAPAPVPEIDGLVAWYDIDTLHRQLRDGARVDTWADSSGNGHDLVDDANGAHAVFHTQVVAGHPAVSIGKGNTHSVKSPFELDDHTLFLVYDAKTPERALFQSRAKGQDALGVVLQERASRNSYKHAAGTIPYNRARDPSEGFTITVLARRSGVLRSWINGADVSTRNRIEGPIHVGRFFRLSKTRAVKIDGEGLRVAEMIFFGRYLEPDQRTAVLRYLSEKYEIGLDQDFAVDDAPERPDVATVGVWLTSDAQGDVNSAEPRAVVWDVQHKLEPPFRHDAKNEERVYSSRNATPVRVFVELPLVGGALGVDVRVLVLKNGQEYLERDASTGPLDSATDDRPVWVRLETGLVMDDGDYIEIVTLGEGAAGGVTLQRGQAAFMLRVDE